MKNRRKQKLKYYFFIAIFLVVLYTFQQMKYVGDIQTKKLRSFNDFVGVGPGRKLLQVGGGNSTENDTETCNEPSIKEFPAGVFTQTERRHGAVLLHIFMALYMFVALAFVCDDYFVSSLDKICERLNLSEDVAGATFMAAGSSAPELFTSIIGVFIAKGDVGVGTIVGSAVFNILVIISICGLFAGQVVHLTWWPLFRDSMFYMLSIASLIWVLYDGHVVWYESLVMLFLYIGYILLMKFNPSIVEWLNARAQRKHMLMERENSESKQIFDEAARNRVKYTAGRKKDYQAIDLIETQRRRVTWRELGMMIMLSDQFSPSTRFRAACLIVLLRGDHKKTETGAVVEEEKNANHVDVNGDSYHYQVPKEKEDSHTEQSTDVEVEVEGTPFLYPTGSILRTVFWFTSLPLVAALYFTIPDCRKKRWEAWYIGTFLMSMVWIAIFSYLLVWMVCVIGFTFGIPDVIMGITFLAAGTSIPDAISSLLVAREGQGDMAVSNSIGSNVFDILIGLALPWFLKSAVVHPGEKVVINSRGMIYSVTLLFLSVLFTVMVIHCNRWKLDKKSGFIFLALYAVFLAISSCIELNVFGFVNFPTCEFHE